MVRTASVVASLNPEPDLVIAALVHSSYMEGNYGTLRAGMTEPKRKQMRSVIGSKAEEYVAAFTRLDWSPKNIRQIARDLPSLSDLDRKMVFLRLANELEEFLDYGIFYCSNAPLRLEGVRLLGSTLVRMADELGYSQLASQLRCAFEEVQNSPVPLFLRNDKEISYAINPRTLTPERIPLLKDAAIRQFQRLRSAVRLRTRIRNWLAKKVAPKSSAPVSRVSIVSNTATKPEPAAVLDNALLTGKNVLITGIGPQIGRSIAIEMKKQGANVYYTDIVEQRCKKLEQELKNFGSNGHVNWISADISTTQEVNALYQWLNERGTDIDILVNNVGIAWERRGIRKFTMNEWEKIFRTNLFGPLQLTQLVAENMISKSVAGSILFLSSIHQWTIYGSPSYSSSKAALGMAVKELALELAPHGIRVNGIAPGWVEEDETGNALAFPRHRLWETSIYPCYIGRAAVYLCSDYFSRFTTGTMLQIDSGLTLFNPQESV
jgi:NAD(P)-dependent dehydrogenase (short-subunit alcohol dehydrogenase family)